MIKNINNPRFQIYIYGVVVFFFWMALNLYAPTLPVYIKTRINNLTSVGVVLSMYGLFGTLFRLPLGIATDWLGRFKPIFAIGILMEGLGAWLMGTTDTLIGLIIGRAICGLAAGSWVVVVVSFSSLFPFEDAVKATVILTMIPSFGRLIGSVMTGWLNDLGGYPLAFFVSTGFAVLAFLFLMLTREIKQPSHAPSLSNLGKLAIRREVLVPSLLNIIGQYVVMGAVFGFIPILAQRFGAGNVKLSLLVTIYVVFYAIGNLTATRVNRIMSSRTITIIGIVLMAVGYGIAAIAPTLVWLFIAQACYGFAGGVSYPVIMGLCIEKVNINERSTAMGLHQTIYSIGGFIGPWLSGILADSIGLQPMFGVTAFVCLGFGILGVAHLSGRKKDGEVRA